MSSKVIELAERLVELGMVPDSLARKLEAQPPYLRREGIAEFIDAARQQYGDIPRRLTVEVGSATEDQPGIDLNKVQDLLRGLNGYLACVEAAVLEYERTAEDQIETILVSGQFDAATRKLAFDMLEQCLRVRFSQHQDNALTSQEARLDLPLQKGDPMLELTAMAMKNPARETYLEKKDQLLQDHLGEYVWIVGEEIREIGPSLPVLLKKARDCDKSITIVRRIEEDPEFIEF